MRITRIIKLLPEEQITIVPHNDKITSVTITSGKVIIRTTKGENEEQTIYNL